MSGLDSSPRGRKAELAFEVSVFGTAVVRFVHAGSNIAFLSRLQIGSLDIHRPADTLGASIWFNDGRITFMRVERKEFALDPPLRDETGGGITPVPQTS
jgi:hypothetical protein